LRQLESVPKQSGAVSPVYVVNNHAYR
jgi:hypothetical protein